MKKYIMKLVLGFFVLVAFSACKKDYTCTCVNTFEEEITTSATTIKAKKADAEDACDLLDVDVIVDGSEFVTKCAVE